MQGKTAIRLGVATLLAAVPSYLVERVTEFYFLTSNPAFFAWSGDRTPIFITLLLLAALFSGYTVENLSAVAAAFIVGIVILISLLYSLCALKHSVQALQSRLRHTHVSSI